MIYNANNLKRSGGSGQKYFNYDYTLDADPGFKDPANGDFSLSDASLAIGAGVSDWTDWGGTNGTPKTDMYTENYNISLKKKGGSQLASGGSGETIANFNAALAYLGTSREDDQVINDIMEKIELKP